MDTTNKKEIIIKKAEGTSDYKKLCQSFEKLNIIPLLSGNLNINNFFKLNTTLTTTEQLDKKHVQLMKLLRDLRVKMKYISSGSTGHFFKCAMLNNNNSSLMKDNIYCKFALKMIPYLKRSEYKSIYEISRPENTELNMLKALSYFVLTKQTNHIILPIQSFYSSITDFVKMITGGKINDPKKRYETFMKNYENGRYENVVSVIIMELANCFDLLTFIKEYHLNLKLIDWKIFFFQLLSVLAIIQSKFSSFRHNDLKANNILVHAENIPHKRKYIINNNIYNLPKTTYVLKLCDFDFACIPGYVNNIKVTEKWTHDMNITVKENKYYDIHYFFNTLIHNGFFPQIMNPKFTSIEIIEFINRVVPLKYRKEPFVNKKGRLIKDIQYLTPLHILENDEFFAEFR